jgi:hypothetical protein
MGDGSYRKTSVHAPEKNADSVTNKPPKYKSARKLLNDQRLRRLI